MSDLPADISVDRPHSEWLLIMRSWTKEQVGEVLNAIKATQGARQSASLHKLAGDMTGTPSDCKLAVTAMLDIVSRLDGKIQDGPSVLVQQHFSGSNVTVTTNELIETIGRFLENPLTDPNPSEPVARLRGIDGGPPSLELRPSVEVPDHELPDSEESAGER